MKKEVYWFTCFCVVGILATLLLKPAKKAGIVSNSSQGMQSIHKNTIMVVKPAFIQTVPAPDDSGNFNATDRISYQTPAQDNSEPLPFELHSVLRNLRAWATKEPESALAAAMKMPEGDQRDQAMSAVCLGLADIDPANAVKLAQTLNLGKQPGAVMENLVQQWATSDLSSALDWANSQPVGDKRDGFTTRIAYVMSQSDPNDAADLVINQISPGPIQDEAVMMVLNQLAHQNLAAAVTWVKGFPQGPLQARAVKELEEIVNYRSALAHQ